MANAAPAAKTTTYSMVCDPHRSNHNRLNRVKKPKKITLSLIKTIFTNPIVPNSGRMGNSPKVSFSNLSIDSSHARSPRKKHPGGCRGYSVCCSSSTSHPLSRIAWWKSWREVAFSSKARITSPTGSWMSTVRMPQTWLKACWS